LEVERIVIIPSIENRLKVELEEWAAKSGVVLATAPRGDLDRLTGGAVHQGVVAYYRPPALRYLEDVLPATVAGAGLIMLDGVEDPHNLGAVIRSAEVFGAAGVVIPGRRAAGLTPAVVKSSAGAALRTPPVEVSNLHQAIHLLKKSNVWVYGLDPAGTKVIWESDLTGSIAFVLGSEGGGLSRLTKDLCDDLIAIPRYGQVGSLNVSNTAAIVLAELRRQNRSQVPK